MSTLAASAVVKVLGTQAWADLLTAGDVGHDAVGGPFAGGWLSQSTTNEMAPATNPQGSGKASVVLAEREGWTTPNPHNTSRFPSLWLVVYADCSRDAGLLPTSFDGRDRAMRIFQALDPIFHDVANRDHDWPLSFRVNSCVRLADPVMTDVLLGDYTVQLIARYGVSC